MYQTKHVHKPQQQQHTHKNISSNRPIKQTLKITKNTRKEHATPQFKPKQIKNKRNTQNKKDTHKEHATSVQVKANKKTKTLKSPADELTNTRHIHTHTHTKHTQNKAK